MDREAHIREMLAFQDEVAAIHAARIEAVLAEGMKAVADTLQFTHRSDPPPEFYARIGDAMRAMYREVTRGAASLLVGQFKSGFTWLETKEDEEGFYERLYEEFMAAFGARKIVQVSDTTRRQIGKIIEKGLKEGLSVVQIADRIIEAIPTIAKLRSAVIARTETHSASMYSSQQSAKRSTVPLMKEWASVEDHRTRDFGEADGVVDAFNHRKMDGVKVPLDMPFEVPNRWGFVERLMFPGDPNGSAGNIINCRCVQTYVVAN